MGRVERRMVRRARGQVLMRRALLFLTALILAAGLLTRGRGPGSLQAQALPEPTATPVASAFDETVTTREIKLPADAWYAIQTGIFSGEDAAKAKAGAYADRGAPGLVMPDGSKYRVFIASYGMREDANAVRERLREKQNVETYLHEWGCPSLTLRLTGMAGQLDVAEAGLTMAGQMAALLRDRASMLDMGEVTAAEARKMNASLGEQLRLWLDTAQARFSRPYPALISQELALTQRWLTHVAALDKAAQEGATALSAEMKLRAMAMYGENIALRQALENE